jgi:hypothetical protein
MASFQEAVEAGQRAGKLALYFGCFKSMGHFLHYRNGLHVRGDAKERPPWSDGLMDGGLLSNGKRRDVYDGKVFWTAGGAEVFWYAFCWWDNSVDRRPAANSGFYVRGFGWPEAQAAFDYACAEFPGVVSRQAQPLELQSPKPDA